MKAGIIITLFGLLATLSAEDGKTVYQTYCSACHGANGEGRTGAAPALAQSSWVNGDPNIITKVLLHGVQGHLTMHGESYELVMPAQTTLSDKQMADVASYVRNQWGNKAAPISESFFKKTREETKNQNGVIGSMHFIRPYGLKDQTIKVKNLLSSSYPFTTDFDSLKDETPESVEEEKRKLIDPLQAGSQKESFTAKWTGLLNIEKEDEYHFSYGTDNAARISIDGKVILERAKGAQPSVGSIRLSKGEFEIEIYYAHEAKSPIFHRLFLSGGGMNMRRMHNIDKRKKTLAVTINPTSQRALVHRNFLVKGGERTLAVGFPQKVNFNFSTQNMRLSKVWKGEFLNVGDTWNGRARGKIATPRGKAFPVVEKGAVFKEFSTHFNQWDDKKAKAVEQQFRGYSFDKVGNPTFTYEIGGYTFTDYFSVSKETQSLTRKITVEPEGKAVDGLYWKMLEKVSEDGSSYKTAAGVQVYFNSSSSKPDLIGKDLILPITKPTTITLKYVWK